MAGTLYDYLQGGPTLSGFKQQTGSLSGVMPGALSQGYQRGMQLPAAQAGGTYGYTGGAMGGQTGQALPRSVATSLSPNLMQAFGVYGASQTPQQQAVDQATRNVPYYGLGTQPGDTGQQALINDILARIGAPTVAEQQQVAANRTSGETALDTAARMQLSPQAQIAALLGGGLSAYSTLGGAQDFLTNPTFSSGLGTTGTGLQAAGSLGQLAGLDPRTGQLLSGIGKLAGVGGQLANPSIYGSFTSPAWPGIGGSSPQTMTQLSNAGNLASGVLGAGGLINTALGGDPRLSAGLGLGSSAATLGGAMAAEAATGAIGSSLATTGGTLAGTGLGTTLGLAGLPWAIGALISSFTSAEHAAKMKAKANEAKDAMAQLKANMPQTQAALQKWGAGDQSVLPYLMDQFEIAQKGTRGLGYVNPGDTAPFNKYAVQLLTAMQKGQPGQYENVLREAFNRKQAIEGVDPMTGRMYGQGIRTGAQSYANVPIERIYELLGYMAPRHPRSTVSNAVAQGWGNIPGGSANPAAQIPAWGYAPAPSAAWDAYQWNFPTTGGRNPALMSDADYYAMTRGFGGGGGYRPVGNAAGGGTAGVGGY